MSDHRRPLVKVAIELPTFVKHERVQEIAKTVWLQGGSLTFRGRNVEVEIRPKREEAAAVVASFTNAVLAAGYDTEPQPQEATTAAEPAE